MSSIKINGVVLPSPTKLEYAYQDLVTKSGRNARGIVRFNLVRSDTRSLNLEWKFLTRSEFQTLYSSFRNQGIFEIEFFDAEADEIVTKRFYKSDRKVIPYFLHDLNSVRFDIQLEFVEE